MTAPAEPSDRTVYEQYVANVRILELSPAEDAVPERDDVRPERVAIDSGDDTGRTGTHHADSRYRFEAPEHRGIAFEDPELATLYADVYFDVNGFEETGTGERGVPPIVIQAGRDTLAAYFLTQPYTDERWVASFMGVRPEKVGRYVSRVRKRAEEIRRQVAARDGTGEDASDDVGEGTSDGGAADGDGVADDATGDAAERAVE